MYAYKHFYVFLCCFYGALGQELVPDMYCGVKNCYDVLGLTSSANKGEISKTYRKLAREYHPDYLQSHGASKKEIEEGVEKFHAIATAYETLRDSREEYDYYLQHPEEYLYNYYRYYKHKINVDVRIVIVGTISVISVFQYISWMTSYNTAIAYMAQNSKYRTAAKEEAKARGLWKEKSEQRKKNRCKTKDEIKQEEEDLIKSIIMEKMDIRGGYQKPEYTDVLWMQIILFPYYSIKFIGFYVHWFIHYTIMKEEYTDEAKIYLICKNLDIKHVLWGIQRENDKQTFIRRELWIKSNAKDFLEEKKEEAKIKMADDPKMKRYRRWMNKGGPGRMTFED